MPAYVISEVRMVDEAAVAAYRPLAKGAAGPFDGEYLARDAVPEALEGSFAADERLVILWFPGIDAARRWYSSDLYAEALAAGAGGRRRRLFVFEGR